MKKGTNSNEYNSMDGPQISYAEQNVSESDGVLQNSDSEQSYNDKIIWIKGISSFSVALNEIRYW